MRLIVALNDRYARTPDGRVWTDRATWHHGNLQRYLAVFEQVLVVARVRELTQPEPGALRADGPGIDFAAMPYFVGPLQYLRSYGRLKSALRGLVRANDAVMLRLPAWHVSSALAEALPTGHPYGVEVCGDAGAIMAARARRDPLHAWMRRRIVNRSRQLALGAVAASYVTRDYLQDRYPPSPGAARCDACSDVELPDQAFANARSWSDPPQPARLCFVGSLDAGCKGVDLLLESLAMLVSQGLKIELELAGQGRLEPELRRLADRLGIGEQVRFVGHLSPTSEVRAAFDRADLLVLPSRSEGMPRVLLEAMARGLPCVASRVGGVPELLADSCLVPPGDSQALARALLKLARDPARLTEQSRRNLGVARGFAEQTLARSRLAFWRALAERAKNQTEPGKIKPSNTP